MVGKKVPEVERAGGTPAVRFPMVGKSGGGSSKIGDSQGLEEQAGRLRYVFKGQEVQAEIDCELRSITCRYDEDLK